MTRTFLTIVIPFVAPTVAYVIWLYFRQEQADAEAQGRRLPAWQEFPWTWLVSIGAILAITAVVLLDATQGVDKNAEYRPARYEDGKLIPGEFIEKDK